MRLVCKKAQSMAEYAILLAVAVSAIVGMQVYLRRGLQGRLKEGSDFVVTAMNEKIQSSYNSQYEPDYRYIDKDVTQNTSQRQRLFEAGKEQKDYLQDIIGVKQNEVINESRKRK